MICSSFTGNCKVELAFRRPRFVSSGGRKAVFFQKGGIEYAKNKRRAKVPVSYLYMYKCHIVSYTLTHSDLPQRSSLCLLQ